MFKLRRMAIKLIMMLSSVISPENNMLGVWSFFKIGENISFLSPIHKQLYTKNTWGKSQVA